MTHAPFNLTAVREEEWFLSLFYQLFTILDWDIDK